MSDLTASFREDLLRLSPAPPPATSGASAIFGGNGAAELSAKAKTLFEKHFEKYAGYVISGIGVAIVVLLLANAFLKWKYMNFVTWPLLVIFFVICAAVDFKRKDLPTYLIFWILSLYIYLLRSPLFDASYAGEGRSPFIAPIFALILLLPPVLNVFALFPLRDKDGKVKNPPIIATGIALFFMVLAIGFVGVYE